MADWKKFSNEKDLHAFHGIVAGLMIIEALADAAVSMGVRTKEQSADLFLRRSIALRSLTNSFYVREEGNDCFSVIAECKGEHTYAIDCWLMEDPVASAKRKSRERGEVIHPELLNVGTLEEWYSRGVSLEEKEQAFVDSELVQGLLAKKNRFIDPKTQSDHALESMASMAKAQSPGHV